MSRFQVLGETPSIQTSKFFQPTMLGIHFYNNAVGLLEPKSKSIFSDFTYKATSSFES